MNDPSQEELLAMLRYQHNLSCSVVLRENMVGEPRICEGRISLGADKKLRYNTTCGEPCSFICKNGARVQETLDLIQGVFTVLSMVRK